MKSFESLTYNCNPTLTSAAGEPAPVLAMEVLERLHRDLREHIVKAAENGDSFDSTERWIFAKVMEMGGAAMDVVIAAQGTGDLGEQVEAGAGRKLRRSDQLVTTQVRSIFGHHRFKEFTYSAGTHKKIELRPISARMQLPQSRWSFLLQEFSQMFCVDQAFHQAAANLETVFGSKFSMSTLEQTTERMGKQADTFLDALPTPDKQTERQILVVSADCKGVPLIKEDSQPVAAFQSARKRPGNRRMATVTSVYTVDPYHRSAEAIIESLFREYKGESEKPKRPLPTHKHTMAHLPTVFLDEEETVTVSGIYEGMSWLGVQVDKRHQPNQPCVLLMDGQEALWEAASVCIDVVPIEILDIIHVSSYVWEAADLFTQGEGARKAFTRERLLRILHGEVSGVIRGLRRMGSTERLRGDNLKNLQRICGYLEKNRTRMCYDKYLAAGYPIASGVIEGACAHLVKDRMERSGMRWTHEGARNMLNMRAAFQSSYWKTFCQQRIVESSKEVHPHRGLLSGYESLTLSC